MALKPLVTLIRLHKRRVDVIRREMLVLEETRQQLVTLAGTLHDEYLREIDIATQDAKMAGFFGAYAQRMQKRQEEIAREIIRHDAAIEAKAEAIRAEFAEQKKYEIAKTHEMKRIAEKDRARQQSRYDEIGSQQFIQQQELVNLKETPV